MVLAAPAVLDLGGLDRRDLDPLLRLEAALFGLEIDLVVGVSAPREGAQALAEPLNQRGEAGAAEEAEDDDQDDQEFAATESHGSPLRAPPRGPQAPRAPAAPRERRAYE